MSTRTKAILATFGAQIIWGVAGPLVKIVLGTVPPFSLLFFRCLAVSLLLFPLYEFRLLPDMNKQMATDRSKVTNNDKLKIFLAGFVGVFVNIALYFWGQRLTTVIDAWVITSLGVIFILVYSYLFAHERLAKIVYLGIGFAFVGTLIIVGDGLSNFGRGGFLGNLVMVGSTLAAAYSYILVKDLVKKFGPMLIVYYSFLVSLFFALPLFLWEFWVNPTFLAEIPLQSFLIIGYLILGSSILAYFLTNVGLVHLSPSLSSTIGYTGAVVAIGLSILFLEEKPTVYFILGTVIIVIGLFLAETRHRAGKLAK